MEIEKVRPLFRKEEKYALALRRPGSRIQPCGAPLTRRRPSAVAVAAPLLPHMVNQVQCMRFCWRVCGIGAVYPDGSQQPNPFDPKGPDPWPLTDRERGQAGYIAAAFHLLVRTVAAVLHDAGVPLDHVWEGDQAILATLLLLPALDYKIPWDGKIDEFAAEIQPPGVSAFDPGGRSASARDGRPDAMARNADRIRKHIRADSGGRELHVPYADGTGRKPPRATVIRREVLAEILADDPSVSVPQILNTYDYSDRTPGGRLRRELKLRLQAEGCPVPGKPSQSALHDDLAEISGAPATRELRDSGSTHARLRAEARIHPRGVGIPADPEKGSAQ